jgi:hypothetical protein
LCYGGPKGAGFDEKGVECARGRRQVHAGLQQEREGRLACRGFAKNALDLPGASTFHPSPQPEFSNGSVLSLWVLEKAVHELIEGAP